MLNTVSKGNRGFTLIELLVVMAIIAILASLAIPQYLRYQQKGRMTAYAIPIAKACITDLVEYCITHQGDDEKTRTISPVVGANSPAANCRYDSSKPLKVAGGEVTLTSSVDSVVCQENGNLNLGDIGSGGIVATLNSADDFQARCFSNGNASTKAAEANIRCVIEPKPSSP